jgi:hypothetical protein
MSSPGRPPDSTRPAGRRTVIIGDVHGCLDELQELLGAVGVDPGGAARGDGDRVVLVGDLVAKGPDSRGVVAFCRERCFAAVLGNHDAKVLTIGPSAEAQAKARDTGPGHHAQIAATLKAADWAYLASLPLYLALPDLDVLVVHGGLIPRVPLEEQPRDMIINLRSITSEGEPSKRVDAGAPWGSLWPGPTHVVFGHDAVRGLQRHPFATGLDTGCVYGRALTALVLPERRLVSVAARRSYVAL